MNRAASRTRSDCRAFGILIFELSVSSLVECRSALATSCAEFRPNALGSAGTETSAKLARAGVEWGVAHDAPITNVLGALDG